MSNTEFRSKIRQELARLVPSDIRSRVMSGVSLSDSDYARWHEILHEKGWISPSWPTKYGGVGWSLMEGAIFDEECYLAGAPRIWPMGVRLIGPVICKYGTEEQKEEHLEAIRNGSRFWCQGFSEPNSGSDLATLSTKAILDGDDFVVNGQKIWTTQAHIADWIFCLVRTSKHEDKRNGISLLLIDMKSPGVSVVRINSISGNNSVNEVYFDNVKVPQSNMIGDEGEGWKYTRFILNNERIGLANIGLCKLEYFKLCLLVEDVERYKVPEHKKYALERELKNIEIRIAALDGLNRLNIASQEGGGKKHIPSVLKIIGSEVQQSIVQIKLKYFSGLSMRTKLVESRDYSSTTAAALPVVISEYFEKRKVSIYGGVNEVQRDLIARAIGVIDK